MNIEEEKRIARMARIAFITAQAAHLNATVLGMEAENQIRLSHGHTVAYGDGEIMDVLQRDYPLLEPTKCKEYLGL